MNRADRQVQSIDGQINEMTRIAQQQGYHIVDVLIEHKSAKEPGRPVFNQMIERIKKGEAEGILCWKLNRLARNPVDAGTIAWLMDQNAIKIIHCSNRTYLPTDNVLMMQIDFGIANQFIKDLKGDVRRGTRDKAKDGWCPQSILPIGYVHHPLKQNAKVQIICDPKRFPIVQELWRLIQTEAYSIVEIKRLADQMGLVNNSGKPYALNTFHLMFKNPMYYGKFYWTNKEGKKVLWKGKHKAIVSEIVFNTVKEIIARKSKKIRPQAHFYTYRGLIACGGCGGHITAERKLQVICSNCKFKYSSITNKTCAKCDTPMSRMNNPSIIDKVYYHCTKKVDPRCSQKSITESEIENEVIKVLSKVSIPDQLFEWSKKQMDNQLKVNYKGNTVLIDSLRRKRDLLNQKVKNLLELRVSGEITKEQLEDMKRDYEFEIAELEQKIFKKENALSISLYEAHTYLNFAQNCIEKFKNGSQKTKKEIVAFFCSNLTLFNKSLYFSTKKAPDVLDSLQKNMYTFSGGSNLKIREIT
jgi:DNA invertase Pin-like site-specific DNA recombinase